MAIAPLPAPDEDSMPYRFTLDEFVNAWEVGVFSKRVELIDGEVWPVVIGPWHGQTTMQLPSVLPREGVVITSESLASGGSLPDPDCWVRRAGVGPITQLSRRIVAYHHSDVLLVVEVSDETVALDLGKKAVIYAQAGYPYYWVATREGIHEHTEPGKTGYGVRRLYGPGERIPVAYAGTDLAVDDLIAPA